MPTVSLTAFRSGLPSTSSRDGRDVGPNHPAARPHRMTGPGERQAEPTSAMQVARRGRLGRSGCERRCHDGVRGAGSSSAWGDLRDDLLAAAGGPAPEGGTASSASAKVPRGRLAPRRSRTPTRGGIKRHGACTGF